MTRQSQVPPVLSASVTLTSAQILALFTTSIQILPAPGAGLAYLPLAAFFNYQFKTTAYTDGGGNILILVGTLGLIGQATAGFWDQGASQMFFHSNSTSSVESVASWANQPMKVGHTVANPTLGDGEMTVTVLHMLLPVS